MKKKTVLGATALAVLGSTIPVHITPASANGVLTNPVSTALDAENPMEVYTGFTGGNSNNSGNGSFNNPYNRFEDAVAKVKDGGTIYIKDKAFLNDVGNNLPFLIDKNITIKSIGGTHATLSVNSAGILLGANVKFENISLSFANRYHDSIFANGYRLDLINVSRADGTRLVDLFAGGLYMSPDKPIHPSGKNAVINVETNGNYQSKNLDSEFGNIYAGSMNGKFDGTAEINVARKDNSKRLVIGGIKSSGALEAYVSGNFFDFIEPDAPAENPELFPMNGNVSINLDDYQVSVDGKTGSEYKTGVTTHTRNLGNLELKDVSSLSLTSGHLVLTNSSTGLFDSVTLGEDAKLDLTKAPKEITVGDFNGNGAVVLREDGKLNITNEVSGSIDVKLKGEWGDNNGYVTDGHTYITTPTKDAQILFTPNEVQSKLGLVPVEKDGLVEWIAGDPKVIGAPKDEETEAPKEEEVEKLKITGFIFEDGKAEQTKMYEEPNVENGFTYTAVKFPFVIETNRELTDGDEIYLEEYNFNITVNGKEAVYREEENDFFVEDLGLSLYFNTETGFDEHELVVVGLNAEGVYQPIKVGKYDIQVSNSDAKFNVTLTVTGTSADEEVPPKEEEENEEPTTPVEAKELQLAELQYDTKKSNTAWNKIQVNKNTDGKPIELIVDGERTIFEKGMGAHATSNLVYDISQYSEEYTRFVSYIGVNATQGGNGNGVKFIIYTSQDGTTWEEVHATPVIKGNQESLYVDIPLNGAKYIKLHAHDNGANGNDHAVYGDLKLVNDAYSISSTPVEELKTVAEYDAILSKNTVEENMQNHKMTIMRRDLVKRIGYEGLQRIASKSEENAQAINYLMTDETALTYYITGGKVTKDGIDHKALTSFIDIYTKHKKELLNPADNHFNLRLAVSVSLAYAHTELVRFWAGSDKPISALNRYEAYQELVKSGNMDKGGENDNAYSKWSTQQFKDLPIPLMRWVVDNRINDDEIMWLADYALAQKEAGRNFLDAYNYINYTFDYKYDKAEHFEDARKEEFNNKYGNFLDYIDEYGTPNVYRLWMVFKEGSVCGGLAKTYANLAESFGRPSSVVGQPGHAATMTWGWNTTNKRYEWMLQNDISGWAESGNEYNDRLLNWGNKSFAIWHGASYNILATDAVQHEKYEEVTLLNLLAESYDSAEDKKEIYEKALALQGINLDSMEGLVYAYKNTNGNLFELAKRIITTYTYYPQTMMEILTLFESEITNPSESAQLDILKRNALLSASQATPDKSTNVAMSKQLANKYLQGNQATELATFSFDGKNAGKIVLDSKYDSSDIRVRYSLDNGKTWTESGDHAITLTKEQLASITAENDIIVGLVGASESLNHRIDIVAAPEINQDIVTLNDDENLLLGNTANLEFSYDGGEWCDYVTGNEESINPKGVTGIRFEGNKTVKLRYKANGTQLQSETVEYKFTDNADTDEKKYIPLKNVKLIESSAYQNGSNPEMMIDGLPNTNFHTPHGKTTANKFVVLKLDKPRYITSIQSMFGGGNNGRLKDGYIQVSLDGENWETVKTIEGMKQNVKLEEYALDESVKAEYIKIVATQTHGNSTSQENMYYAIAELKFFEDTTIVEDTPTLLPDDVPVEEETIQPPTPVIPQEPTPEPPSNIEGTQKPSTEDTTQKPSSGSGGQTPTTPPVENKPNTTPPVEDKPSTPPKEEDKVDVPTIIQNGIENLKGLGEKLQEKVDSIIADVVVNDNTLSLSISGDKEDVKNITTLEVTKEGLFANVDGEKLKFDLGLDVSAIDLDNSRVVRVNKSRNSKVTYSAVPHKNTKDGLKITTGNLEDILILPKVDAPFKDVSDNDWFKAEVEEAYNYGFTTGTTATTFDPNANITRAQFAVMIARALELTPNKSKNSLSDIEGKWYQDEAQALYEAGIIKGFGDGTFGGEEKLTRQQASTMLVNMLKHTGVNIAVAGDVTFGDMDKISEHAQEAVKYLASQDILVNGDNVNFNPYNNLTRAQMAKMLVRSLRLTDLY